MSFLYLKLEYRSEEIKRNYMAVKRLKEIISDIPFLGENLNKHYCQNIKRVYEKPNLK
jgi:hypothetical protein